MEIALDARTDVNLIRSYTLSELVVGEHTINTNCIVAADALVRPWGPETSTQLNLEDLEAVFALEPQVVLMGTGARQQFPSAAIRAAFAARNIGLEVMDLGAACRTYNVLVQEERRAAAVLFLKG